MILPFKTKFKNGRRTYFPMKIWKSLKPVDISEYIVKMNEEDIPMAWIFSKLEPKLHTIREDKNNRWKAGVMIDFFINNRTKNALRFAPRVPCVSTQDIFMTWRGGLEITVADVGSCIGGDDHYLSRWELLDLSRNDGFDDYGQFEKYFYDAILKNGKETGNYWFSGKIIHWTGFKY